MYTVINKELILFEKDSYITSSRGVRPKGKLPFFKKVLFYIKFISLVLKTRKAVVKRNAGTGYVAENCEKIVALCESVGAEINITGLDNIRNIEGGAVIAANHMSTIETLLFPAILNNIKKQVYVVKKSLVTGWVFGPIMRLYDPIALERDNPRIDLNKVLTEGTKALKEGKSVILFPQGTRSKNFDPGSFNSLAVKLAKIAGAKVIPCALKTDFWENGKTISTIGDIYPERTIYFAFGKPETIERSGKNEQKRIVDFIDQKFKTWQELSLHE